MGLNAQIIKDSLQEFKARKFFTPDFKELEMYDNHLVFVWDNLKYTFPQQKETAGLKFLGEAYTFDDNFVMKNTPSYPIIYEVPVEGKEKHYATRVYGQVFVITAIDLVHMDAIMDNGGSFERKKRWICLRDQESPFKDKNSLVTREAWVYTAKEFFKNEVLKGAITATQRQYGDKHYWEWRHANLPN